MRGGLETEELHLVHLINGSKLRGAERFAIQLSNSLKEVYPHQTICAMSSTSKMEFGLEGQALIRLKGGPTSLSSVLTLRHFFRQPQNMVLIAHGYSAMKLAAAATFGLPSRNKPIIINKKIGSTISWIKSFAFIRLWLHRFVLNQAHTIVALGPNQHTELINVLGVPKNKVCLIPNARRRPTCDIPSHSGRQRPPRIIMLGSLSEEKNPKLALEIVADLKRKGYPCHLDLVGDGKLRPSLEEDAQRLGIAAQITFHGHVDEPGLIMANGYAMLICSKTEGFPGVAIEAAMWKLPVVCWDVGEVSEIVQNGKTGFCTPYQDRYKLTEAVRTALSQPELCAKLSECAYRDASRFDIDVIAHNYHALISRITETYLN